MAKVRKRSDTDHFLVGFEQPSVVHGQGSGSKILTTRAMLQYFLYRKNQPEFRSTSLADIVCCPLQTGTKTAKCQVSGSDGCIGSGSCVVSVVKHDGNWSKSGIPIISDFAIKEKVVKIISHYKKEHLKKQSQVSGEA